MNLLGFSITFILSCFYFYLCILFFFSVHDFLCLLFHLFQISLTMFSLMTVFFPFLYNSNKILKFRFLRLTNLGSISESTSANVAQAPILHVRVRWVGMKRRLQPKMWQHAFGHLNSWSKHEWVLWKQVSIAGKLPAFFHGFPCLHHASLTSPGSHCFSGWGFVVLCSTGSGYSLLSSAVTYCST